MSNRLTFSLASLIVLIAFGLVFGTTSVMAHPDASGDSTTTPRPHSHPLEETLPAATADADVTAGRAGVEVTPHNAHPTVQSVVLKAGDTVRDNMVAVSAITGAQTDALDANEFILVITFDQDVAGTNDVSVIPARDTETAPLAADEFAQSLLNVDNTAVSGSPIAFTTVGRAEGTANNVFEALITVSTFPSGTADANDEMFTFRVMVNAGAVFSLQTTNVVQNVVDPVTVAGGGSAESTVYDFTLVNALPEIVVPPDTTAPTVMVEAPDAINAAGKLPFTITFSEMLASTGFGAFTLMDDVTITGGTAMAADLDASAAPVYTLNVTPNNPRIDMVTVTVGEVIQDVAGNPLDTAGSTLSASYMRPDTGNTPPYFTSGASVPNIKIWQGYAYSTAALPTARDNEADDPGNRITYRIEPALPAGFELVFDSASDWFIEVKEANKGMTVATPSTATTADKTYSFIADDGTDDSQPLTFMIEVLARIVPTAPTMVMAAEEGYMADPTARTVNTNHVMVSWMAPTDAANAAVHPADTPFGSPVTGYKVYQTGPDGTMVEYPKAGEAKIMADATSYITSPPALGLGEYTFEVVAINAVGDGAKSDATMDGAKAVVLNTPSEPRDLRAAQGSEAGSVALNWKSPINEGDADGRTDDDLITDYQILVVHPDDEEMTMETGSAALTYQVEDLEPGKYVFRVSAINMDGVGESSDGTAFEVTIGAPPTDPTNNAPVFASDAAIARIDAMVNVQIQGRILPEATDADGDTLTYSIEDANGMATTSPAGLTFTASNRALTGKPTAASAEAVYTYKVSDGKGGTDTIPFFITVNAATAGPPVTSTTMLDANGFIVYVRDEDNPPNFGTSNPKIAEWADMPNLWELFSEGGGGSLQLTVNKADGTNVGARQVVFSEIMWAVDEGKVGQDSYDGNQWIELRNRTATAIPISDISFAVKADGRPALAQSTDLVSNVVGGGADWIGGKGQNGNSTAGSLKEFISMYRKRYHNDSAGWNAGEWLKSDQVYHPNYKGTPGKAQPQGPKTFTTSGVALGTVFNEISNSSNPSHEWIELRKREGELSNLEKWVVHMVTGADDRDVATNPTQEKLFQLPKLNDGRYGDILLITKTDPARDDDHPLRGGYNVEKSDADQDGEGRDKNIRYYVADDWTKDLPDDGKFVLILRHGNDKTNHEKIQDTAGYHPNLKVERADFFSNLWPLVNYPAADIALNKIEVNKVHRRQKDNIAGTRTADKKDNADHVALRDVGWTSIGYKRNADAGAKNGGTPGYPNGAQLSNETQAGADPVIISEIMYATGARNNIPQWIELRNTSDSRGVNLDGWRVTIVNHDQDDADGTTYSGDLSKSYNINGKIPPGQTFLIVAHSGTDNTKLPSERIQAIRSKRGDRILSQYGFEITVENKEKDGSREMADMVGNLGAAEGRRSKSFADTTWDLPAGTNEDGDRVSITRVMGSDGMDAASWNNSGGNSRESTYYGNRSDIASPGYVDGGVLPVSLSKFRPERLDDGSVAVRWVTESELDNAGFNILRGEALDAEFTKLNTKLIAGQGTTSERTVYEFVDTTAKPNVVYYYQIQDVSIDGEVQTLRTTHLRGNVSAAGKAATTWGELKALQ